MPHLTSSNAGEGLEWEGEKLVNGYVERQGRGTGNDQESMGRDVPSGQR